MCWEILQQVTVRRMQFLLCFDSHSMASLVAAAAAVMSLLALVGPVPAEAGVPAPLQAVELGAAAVGRLLLAAVAMVVLAPGAGAE
ncbi:hypothetical protein [Paraburkholderia sp. RL18-085-BIA-A]|uniref:hypothetical protein n=1 Tax=Paraburkholderia sp. RL18-085-BIA-A TaxID=3031633 RepID=UPI0038BB8181